MLRSLLFALIWAVLTNALNASWWIGIPAVLLALWVSLHLLPPVPFSGLSFLRLIPFFIVHSVLGGIDVARRVFHPDLPIEPGRIEYVLSLPPGVSRVFMSSIVNLLPGTLSVEFEADLLVLHVLDVAQPCQEELQAIEQRVADIFAIPSKSCIQES